MTFFILWLAVSLIPAVLASKRGRSDIGWFLLSMVISPILATIIVVAIKDLSKKQCKACGQQIPVVAQVCPFCKAADAGTASVETLGKKCPSCAEQIKLEALVCRFCGHKFAPEEVQAVLEQAQGKPYVTETEKDKKESASRRRAKWKLSRGLCPDCDAYQAFSWERRKGFLTCEVCGAQYPLSQVYS